MARIRTIKPEFWTDDKVVQVSIPARLLFIGLWNFADDSGNLENSPAQIKMRILPADSESVPPLLRELTSVGLLREYSVNGKIYLNIPGFTSHQVINKPSKTRLPPPPTTGVLPDGREGNGREVDSEGKGKKKDLDLPQPVDNSKDPLLADGANDGGNAEGHPPVAPTPGDKSNVIHLKVKALNLAPEKEAVVAGLFQRYQEERIRADDISEALRGAGLDHQEVLLVAPLFIG